MKFSGILIGSENPEQLVEYYTRLFGAPTMTEAGFTGWKMGDAWVTVGPHDQVKGRNTHPGRLIWNMESPNVKSDFEKYKAAGAIVEKEPYGMEDDSDFSIATFADPDGNFFQLMAPMPAQGN